MNSKHTAEIGFGMARRSRAIFGLALLLGAFVTTTNFAVQRLPKPRPEFNEGPGSPFTFQMEMPDWLMEALGAGPKTGSDVNNSVLDFSLDYHILAGAIFGLALFYVGIFG